MTENNPLAKRHIVLIGMMGVGKTRVGRELSKKCLIPFVDSDQEIEKAANMPIAEIFATYGEVFFREREAKVMARLLDEAGAHIIASGGGAFLNAATREKIKKNAVSIWLTADLEVTVERALMKKAQRPLLADAPQPKEKFSALFEKRKDIYALSDLICDTTHHPPEMVADEIIAKLKVLNADDKNIKN
jgi:shikimate kinase